MILKGYPTFLGTTFSQAGLNAAVKVFDSAGAITGWMALTNFDGTSYRLPYTFAAAGAFSAKYVIFTDGTFATRDTGFSENDGEFQVIDPAIFSGGGSGAVVILDGIEVEVDDSSAIGAEIEDQEIDVTIEED